MKSSLKPSTGLVTGLSEVELIKSITLKLVLSFSLISLVAVMIVLVIVQSGTTREFNTYLYNDYQNTIVTHFEQYYIQNQTWDGVQGTLPTLEKTLKISPLNERRLPFTLADTTDHVILAGGFYDIGDLLLIKDQRQMIPIGSPEKPEGYLVIPQPGPQIKPPPAEFTRNFLRVLIVGGLTGLLVALVIGFLLSKWITRPVLELTAGVHEISNGNLEQNLPIHSKDELGTLTREFNAMAYRLKQLLLARKQMTADIAHELRTPISVILGHAEGIHDGVIEPSAETLSIIREEAIRLEKLVDDLRTLSLSDAGELKLNLSAVSAQSLLDKVSERYLLSTVCSGVAFSTFCEEGLPDLYIDADRIMQVISNLIENSCRNSPDGGRIRIEATRVKEGVQISVADTGNGIPEEDLERIFERLYRVETARERKNGGSGLGLAIAKTIIEQHHGRIWVTSAVGVGTTVYLVLPVNV